MQDNIYAINFITHVKQYSICTYEHRVTYSILCEKKIECAERTAALSNMFPLKLAARTLLYYNRVRE
jgi:hypothetical protein